MPKIEDNCQIFLEEAFDRARRRLEDSRASALIWAYIRLQPEPLARFLETVWAKMEKHDACSLDAEWTEPKIRAFFADLEPAIFTNNSVPSS